MVGLLDIGHLCKESLAEIHIKLDLLVMHVTIIANNLFYLGSFFIIAIIKGQRFSVVDRHLDPDRDLTRYRIILNGDDLSIFLIYFNQPGFDRSFLIKY